jgi:hypothetical protein
MANLLRGFLLLVALLPGCGSPPASLPVGPGQPQDDGLLIVADVYPLPDTLPPLDTLEPEDILVPMDTVVCGDGVCQPGEDCGQCPEDCGCPEDEICTDGYCVLPCLPACAGAQCGPDGCGGLCGLCAETASCEGGTCRDLPDCAAVLDCALTCGGVPGDCACGQRASFAAGLLFKPLWDCVLSQSLASGKPPLEIWPAASTGACAPQVGACVDPCAPRCANRACGPDGCGGSCGACGEVDLCVDGSCTLFCLPDCGPRLCGDNGCGGLCGLCPGDQQCLEGQCQADCLPQCQGRNCGPDGCGGVCGECLDHETCGDGQCSPNCLVSQSDQWVSQRPVDLLEGYGSYLLAGGPGGIQILQRATEAPFELVGTITVDQPVSAVAAFFDFLYVASREAGILAFSIADPALPTSAFSIDQEAWDLYLEDDLLVVAAGASGVLLLRVTDPYFPKVVALAAMPGADRALLLLPMKEAVGVLCASGMLRILDLSDNSNPVLRGEVMVAPDPKAAEMLGTRAFILDQQGRFYEANLADLQAPKVAGPFGSGGLQGLAPTKKWLYAAAGEAGVSVFHLKVPLAPDFVFTLPLTGQDAAAPLSFGDNLLVGLRSGGVAVLDFLGCD